MKTLPPVSHPGEIVHVQDGIFWHVGPNPCPSSNVPGLGTSTHLTPSQCDCRWYPTEHAALRAVASWPDHDLSPNAGNYSSEWDHLSGLVSHWWTDEGRPPTLHRLDVLTSVREHAELMTARLVVRAREQGHSWAKIGAELGMTKQAAQQKYGTKASTNVDDPDQLQIPTDE